MAQIVEIRKEGKFKTWIREHEDGLKMAGGILGIAVGVGLIAVGAYVCGHEEGSFEGHAKGLLEGMDTAVAAICKHAKVPVEMGTEYIFDTDHVPAELTEESVKYLTEEGYNVENAAYILLATKK